MKRRSEISFLSLDFSGIKSLSYFIDRHFNWLLKCLIWLILLSSVWLSGSVTKFDSSSLGATDWLIESAGLSIGYAGLSIESDSSAIETEGSVIKTDG